MRIDYGVRTEAGAELVLDAARGCVGIVDGGGARHAEMHFNGAIAADAARAQIVRVGSSGFFEDRVDNKVFLFFGALNKMYYTILQNLVVMILTIL